MALCLFAAGVNAHADGPRTPGRYVPPASSYILDPAETPIVIQFGTAKLSDVQAKLDAARAADTVSPIVLTLTGTYWIKDKPLILPSKTSLVLYGSIQAFPGSTATSLISIAGQSKVAIAGGTLEGNFAQLAGIDAEASTKINIDSVTIRNTGRDGIILSGNGNTVFDSGSAITRCDVSGSRGNGITVENITQTLLLDNFIHDNRGDGVQLSSAHTSVVNNAVQRNSIGVFADANDNLISDNDLSNNLHSGLALTSTSSNTAVLRNTISGNLGNGVDFDGTNNLIYSNTLSNSTNLSDHSAANWVMPREAPLAATVSQYFYPPTIDNQHNDPVMNGVARTDITVTSSNLTAVQQAYDNARQQNPNNFVVLHMNGDFTADTAPLTLSSNTAVILNGTIHLTAKLTNVINSTNPVSFLSISGGTIDLAGQPIEAIYLPSSKMVNVDHLTVLNGGQRDVRTSKSMIHLTAGGGYNFLYRNTVDQAGGRCIWTQSSSSRYVVLENHLSNCNMDAVDFDSSTSNSFAIDNVGQDNLRYGVFIEQSDSFNKVYGNFTSTSGLSHITGHGVGVYNNATSAGTRHITDGNTVFSNFSDVISNGLRVGSISTKTGGVAETAHTFMFNNIARNSTGDGILFDTQFPNSIDNYFSQTVLSGNKTDLDSHPLNGATPPDFFNPMSAINLALNQPVTASSTAPGSSPANAVDGLSFTGWISSDRSHASLTVDLGSDVSFQRVLLKQASNLGAGLALLERSEDGVHFTPVPGGVGILGPISTLKFAPVTARYVRVQVWNLFGGSNGLREMAVFPE
ncbi:MAG TPA: right-handed parallel beta-helix repeat-containing protein [Edaphobacter sp.]|nr:right-handed parallel beta-helix repeat-containing protein [Edaphobacter sp.]